MESVKGIDLRYEERPLSSFFEKNINLGLVSHNWDEEEGFVKGIINSIAKNITSGFEAELD